MGFLQAISQACEEQVKNSTMVTGYWQARSQALLNSPNTAQALTLLDPTGDGSTIHYNRFFTLFNVTTNTRGMSSSTSLPALSSVSSLDSRADMAPVLAPLNFGALSSRKSARIDFFEALSNFDSNALSKRSVNSQRSTCSKQSKLRPGSARYTQRHTPLLTGSKSQIKFKL